MVAQGIGGGVLIAVLVVGAIAIGRRGGADHLPPVGSPPRPPIDPWPTRAELATGCDPIGSPRPGVEAFRAWALERGGRDGGIWRDCNVGGGRSEHHEGRAWDWLTDVPTARALVDVLLANEAELARRAGLLYLIHDGRIWRAYEPRGWAAYGGGDPHRDHLHVSFTHAGAAGETSFYTHGPGAAYLGVVNV